MPLIRLNGSQRKVLREALREVYTNEMRFKMFLNNELGKDLDDFSASLDLYPEKIDKTIAEAQAKNWLIVLIEKAKLKNPFEPTFESLLKTLTFKSQKADIDPFETCCLSGTHIMINRIQLRHLLRTINKPAGNRILLIKGTPKSGKTHSLQLLAYLQLALGDFEIVPVDLGRYSQTVPGGLIHAEDLASFIVEQMDGFEDSIGSPPVDAQRARWVLQFCDRLQRYARKNPERQWWIVIDGFNNIALNQSALDLVKELAKRINITLANFRLVLIGYSDSFPIEVLPHVVEEEISNIGTQDLAEFFNNAFSERGLIYSENDVVDAVTAVLTQVDKAQPEYLQMLSNAASRELARRMTV